MMHVYAYVTYYLGKKPKHYRGLSSDSYMFGKENPATLAVMVGMFTAMLAEFALNTGVIGLDTINAKIQEAAAEVAKIHFEPLADETAVPSQEKP